MTAHPCCFCGNPCSEKEEDWGTDWWYCEHASHSKDAYYHVGTCGGTDPYFSLKHSQSVPTEIPVKQVFFSFLDTLDSKHPPKSEVPAPKDMIDCQWCYSLTDASKICTTCKPNVLLCPACCSCGEPKEGCTGGAYNFLKKKWTRCGQPVGCDNCDQCSECCDCAVCEVCGMLSQEIIWCEECEVSGCFGSCICSCCNLCKGCRTTCPSCDRCALTCRCFPEPDVAKEVWKIDPRFDLRDALAKFYLLNYLASQAPTEYQQEFEDYGNKLADIFARYLDMVIGGEIRYGSRDVVHPDGEPLLPRVKTRVTKALPRGAAWAGWADLRREYGVSILEEAEFALNEGHWQSGIGGEAWGKVATHLINYLKGEYPGWMFVDIAADLEHNNGCIFNKMWDTSGVRDLLDAKFAGKLEKVRMLASKSTNNWYAKHEARLAALIERAAQNMAKMMFNKLVTQHMPSYYKNREGD